MDFGSLGAPGGRFGSPGSSWETIWLSRELLGNDLALPGIPGKRLAFLGIPGDDLALLGAPGDDLALLGALK